MSKLGKSYVTVSSSLVRVDLRLQEFGLESAEEVGGGGSGGGGPAFPDRCWYARNSAGGVTANKLSTKFISPENIEHT